MITLGYKNKISSLLRACMAIGVGLVMIVPSRAEESFALVVKIIAAFLFAAGVVSLVYGLVNRKTGALPLMVTNAVVDVLIGITLFLFPTQVGSVIVYVLGGVLLIVGLLQLLVFIGTLSLLGGGILAVILSVVAVAGAVILIFNPFSLKVMSVLTGACFIAYGIQELIAVWRVPRAIRQYEANRNSSSWDETGSSSSAEPEGGQTYYEDDVMADPSAKPEVSSLEDAKEVDFEKE